MSKFCEGKDGTIGVEGGSMIGNEGSGDGSNQGGSEITRTNVSWTVKAFDKIFSKQLVLA